MFCCCWQNLFSFRLRSFRIRTSRILGWRPELAFEVQPLKCSLLTCYTFKHWDSKNKRYWGLIFWKHMHIFDVFGHFVFLLVLNDAIREPLMETWSQPRSTCSGHSSLCFHAGSVGGLGVGVGLAGHTSAKVPASNPSSELQQVRVRVRVSLQLFTQMTITGGFNNVARSHFWRMRQSRGTKKLKLQMSTPTFIWK